MEGLLRGSKYAFQLAFFYVDSNSVIGSGLCQ